MFIIRVNRGSPGDSFKSSNAIINICDKKPEVTEENVITVKLYL